jgi:DNA-binding IclR family transcriptional regulator
MATPIYQERREVIAALNMAAHTSMLSIEEMTDRLAPHLVSTADQISARLGYRRDDEASR